MTTPLELDQSVPILILKMGRYPIHHGALGIARSLGRCRVPVYAVVEDRFAPLATSRYLAGVFIWSAAAHEMQTEAFLADLQRFSTRIGCRAVLFCTDDSAAAFAAQHQSVLKERFIFPTIDAGLPRRLSNKKNLYFMCKALGVPCPETAFPGSMDDVRAFIKRAVFPVVVKAMESFRLPKGVSSTSIADTATDLIEIYRAASASGAPNLMFQEYISPSFGEDWIVHAYRNHATDQIVIFSGRKLRSWPPYAGPTTLGVMVRSDALLLQAQEFVRSIEYSGIFDLDYRLDKRDGQYKLLDFNPRAGANFRMFQDSNGLDVARAMHMDLTERSASQGAWDSQRTFVVEPYDLLASLGYRRRGALTVREWWASFKGRKELAWFQADDPMPFFVMCGLLVTRALRGMVRSNRSRLERNRARRTAMVVYAPHPEAGIQPPAGNTSRQVRPRRVG